MEKKIQKNNAKNLAGIQRECKVAGLRKREDYRVRIYNLQDIEKFWSK